MHFGRMVRWYDTLERLHYNSVGRRSSAWFLDKLPYRPRRVLVAACGTGTFVVDLVNSPNCPDHVTVNDLSPEMLACTRMRVEQSGYRGSLAVVAGDIAEADTGESHDLMVIHYLLAMFEPEQRVRFLRAVLRHVSRHGLLMVADFCRPRSWIAYPLFLVNWTINGLGFWALTGVRPNRLGDFEGTLREAGLRVRDSRTFVGGLYGAFLLERDSGTQGNLEGQRGNEGERR